MQVVEMILHCARHTPHKQAIILSDRLVTYGMLAAGIVSAGEALADSGLGRADVVAVIISNRIRRLIITLALYRAGIVSVPLAVASEKVGATATLTDDPAAPVQGRRVIVEDDWFTRTPTETSRSSAGFETEDAAAIIVMSSGTTAGQKPIVWTPRILETRIDMARRNLAVAPWDRMMCLPPVVSAYGLLNALVALCYGHTLLFADRPLEVLQMIALYKVDFVVANPVYLQELVEAHRAAPVPTASINLVLYGGTSIDPRRLSEIHARICPNLLCQYSSTETGVIALGLNETPAGDQMPTGSIVPWVSVEVLGPAGELRGPDEIGLLRVRSPWQAAALNSRALDDGWISPGDIGRISAHGVLTLAGRDSDALVVDGEYVTAEQVEAELARFPGVADAAVVAVPDPSGERRFRAALVASDEPDLRAIDAFLLAADARFHGIGVQRVEAIPRNALGKIDRGQLRATLAG